MKTTTAKKNTKRVTKACNAAKRALKESGVWGRKLPKGAVPCVAGSHCFYCTRPLGAPMPAHKLETGSPTVDHVKARSAGGSDRSNNLVRVCWTCNHTKAGMPPVAWYRDLCANDNDL